MDDNRLSETIRNELADIARRQGFLDNPSKDNDTSVEVIDEFLKYNHGSITLNKNLMTTLMLVSNHLINEGIADTLRGLNLKTENMLVIRLYLYMQMSNNFLDGFLLGHSFLKIIDNKDVLGTENPETLEIFRRIFLIRLKQKESALVSIIDEKTGLIKHFEKAYMELFYTNSLLLKELDEEQVKKIVKLLLNTFFDGILTAKIVSEENRLEG